MEIEININHLRSNLINYFGTGAYAGMPAMMMDICDIEKASDKEIIQIAQRENFDLYKYQT